MTSIIISYLSNNIGWKVWDKFPSIYCRMADPSNGKYCTFTPDAFGDKCLHWKRMDWNNKNNNRLTVVPQEWAFISKWAKLNNANAVNSKIKKPKAELVIDCEVKQ